MKADILILGFMPPQVYATTSNSAFSDPFLQQWLPQPGNPTQTQTSPFLPQSPSPGVTASTGSTSSSSTSLPTTTPPNLPGSATGPSSPQPSPLPSSPVSIPEGGLSLSAQDLSLNSFALPINVTRTYQTSHKDQLSSFGYGWISPFEHYIQMYANFNITEYLPNGNHINYTFTKSDPNLYVSSFDNDPLIYYPLDQGSYAAEASATSKLTRVSHYDYEITEPDGTTYTFLGYRAPWEENAKPAQGKLIQVTDRHGNTMTLTYDSQGRFIQVEDPGKRVVTFGYTGNLVTSMTDPLGQKTTYTYNQANELVRVQHPDGTTDSYTYDSNHNLTSVTSSATGIESFIYSGNRVTEVQQNNQLVYSYQYLDGQKQVIRTDANQDTTTYTYDSDNQITNVQDANGNSYNLTYNADGLIANTHS